MSRPARVCCIAGARPNFMKIAPVLRALQQSDSLEGLLVHTGQHYDANMSDVFFQQLGIPAPEFTLEVGSGSHGVQTGRVMIAFDESFDHIAPDLVLVVGDVNSTIACSLVAVKRGVPVAHVEAGLRSFDASMPEEINRILTDRISDLLFVTEDSGVRNLRAEGVPVERIHVTGNTMIDTLVKMLPQIEAADVASRHDTSGTYGVVTFHRPSNVDDPEKLHRLVLFLRREAQRTDLVFPVHPRTRARLEAMGEWNTLVDLPRVRLLEPLPYVEFMALIRGAAFVVTDSGGLQEETTWLGVPCLTQRLNTERPSTVDLGTNTLVGEDFDATSDAIDHILRGDYKRGERPPLWDGECAPRIISALESFLQGR